MPRVKVFEKRNCMVCDEGFEVNVKSKRSSSRKTCSQKCSGKLGHMNNIVNVNCKICEEEFEISKSLIQKEGNFCSDDCRKKRYLLKCESCQTDFRTEKSTTKYCSEECRHQGTKDNVVLVKCYECDTKFERPSFTVAGNKQVFCSKKCNQRNFARNNPNRYGSRWARIREKRLKMDDYTCQICDKQTFEKYALNVHHIIPIEKFDDIDKANELSNLQTLCYECHMELHGKEIHTY